MTKLVFWFHALREIVCKTLLFLHTTWVMLCNFQLFLFKCKKVKVSWIRNSLFPCGYINFVKNLGSCDAELMNWLGTLIFITIIIFGSLSANHLKQVQWKNWLEKSKRSSSNRQTFDLWQMLISHPSCQYLAGVTALKYEHVIHVTPQLQRANRFDY